MGNSNTDNVTALMLPNMELVDKMANRMEEFLPGGNLVPLPIRRAIAQIGIVHHLDPFMQEIWPIPKKNKNGEIVGWGVMVGIAGHRSTAIRSNEFWGRKFRFANEEERQASGLQPGDVMIICTVLRRPTGRDAMEFDGIGVYKKGEYGNRDPLKTARLRAERDALKSGFPIPGVGEGDDTDDEVPEILNVTPTDNEPVAELTEPEDTRTPEEILAAGKKALGRDDTGLV